MFIKDTNNRNDEFFADLEDHPLGNQNIYRLHYLNYHRIGEYCGRRNHNVGIIDWPFDSFMLPKGMTREDGFKVLSYLTNFIEEKQNINPCSYQSVMALNNALDLERLGFTKIKANINDNDIIDLFTVSGRLQLFKNSEYYSKYFEWYTENITLAEVKAIYAKYGIQFYDLIINNNSNNEFQLIKKK